MGIENDIQQNLPFESIHRKALVNILFTSSWLNEQLKQYFKPHGITSKQYNILRILQGAKHSLSTFQIRDRMLDKMSDVTRILQRMIKKGLITKEVSEHDKRLVDILITDEGLKILQRIEASPFKVEDILRSISEKNCELLNTLLDKARA